MPPIGLEAVVVLTVIGVVMGWLAGLVTRGGGFGTIGNTILAAAGAFLGFYALRYMGVRVGVEPVGLILTGTFGAVVVLFLASRLRQ